MPELVGALMVHGQRVDMVREAEDRLLIPVCPPGVYLAEVRAAGVCVLYGHVEVLPSPLYEQEGVVCYTIDVDAKTDVLAVSLSMVEGIPGPQGEPGPQGAQGTPGAPGLSAYELACLHGYAGSEAEWVAGFDGAQEAVSEARARAEDAAEAARAADDAREAAAADKAAAERAMQDAQAAQSKAQQEATRAEQNAALLGDAALKSADNTFSGANDLTGSLSLAGNPAQAAEEMAYWPVAIQAFMVQAYDWSQCRYDFKKLTRPWRFPSAMPEPEQIRTTANMRGWFNQGLTFTHFPDSWTFEGLTTIFETFSNNSQLREFPAGVTFSNVSNFSFGLNGCKKLVLSETMDFSNATNVSGAFYLCESIEKLPESLTCKGITGMHQMCGGCTKLRTVSKDLDLSNINGKSPYIYEGAAAFAFDGCQLDKDSALRVLNTIGTIPEDIREGRSFSLHIGIHIDHQQDEEVITAIEAAGTNGKGWNVIVQWKGTATAASAASTFGLRQPPIFARVGEVAMPNGTTERVLDWGHYVTDPTGYMEFASVVEAREYFGLPEDD